MATNLLTHLWKTRVPNPHGTEFSTCPVYDVGNGSTITLGATNDVYKVQTFPKGTQMGGNWGIYAGDHDTGAGLVMTLRLNNGTTQKPLIYQTTVGQAGGVARPNSIITTITGIGFVTDSRDWWLELLIDTQAAGAQAAILKIQADYCGWNPPGTVTW